MIMDKEYYVDFSDETVDRITYSFVNSGRIITYEESLLTFISGVNYLLNYKEGGVLNMTKEGKATFKRIILNERYKNIVKKFC